MIYLGPLEYKDIVFKVLNTPIVEMRCWQDRLIFAVGIPIDGPMELLSCRKARGHQ